MEPAFQTFWDRYGKKRERGDAMKAWQRLTPEEQQAAIDGIPAYRRQCEERGTAMLYAQGYLNQRRWQQAGRRRGRKPSSPPPSTSDPFGEMEMW